MGEIFCVVFFEIPHTTPLKWKMEISYKDEL